MHHLRACFYDLDHKTRKKGANTILLKLTNQRDNVWRFEHKLNVENISSSIGKVRKKCSKISGK